MDEVGLQTKEIDVCFGFSVDLPGWDLAGWYSWTRVCNGLANEVSCGNEHEKEQSRIKSGWKDFREAQILTRKLLHTSLRTSG